MKKFLFLMAMVCSLGFFASCSSDDNNNSTPSVWETFKGGDYSVWCDDLDLTDSTVNYQLLDFTMNVAKAGDNTAKVNIKTADNSIVINVPEAAITAQDGYTLKGAGTITLSDKATSKADDNSTEIKDGTVSIKFSADYKTVSVELVSGEDKATLTNADKPSMAKLLTTMYTLPTTWYDEDGNQVEAGSAEAVYPAGSFKFNWTTKEGTVIDFGAAQIPTSIAALLSERMANQNIGNVLHSVAFTLDGRIIAQYRPADSKDGKWKIAEGYATYQTLSNDPGKIYVNLDTEKILGTVTDAEDKVVLSALLNLFKNTAIPVNITWDDANSTAFFYLDKAFAQGLVKSVKEDATLKNLINNLKDEDLDGMGAMIKSICAQVPGLMGNTTELQAGLVLLY